ncbi:hypothetical protein KRP22_014088 [Phytophthora ramorum]|nr:Centromere protein J [Phytophthora ramorum]
MNISSNRGEFDLLWKVGPGPGNDGLTMAPGGRAWRKENDAGNRRLSVTSSEDVPVSGAKVPFEELLARELRKSEGNGAKSTVTATGKVSKKPFLKRGARGWWMQRPGAKQKVVKHKLVSKVEEEEVSVTRRQKQRRRSSLASSSGTLSPVTTPPELVRTAPGPSQTLSPPVSPIRQTQRNNQADNDGYQAQYRKQQADHFAEWQNASFRSTTSTDIMGMKHVRQSYEAKQEREANEMAEFEAIERDLAAEKEAYLMEKQQQQSASAAERRDQVPDTQTDENHWGLPYSSFVSDLHEQERSRWQTAKSGSIFDDNLDEEADSALVFDDHSTLSKDDWMADRGGFTNQLRDHFGYGNNYGDPPSELSAVSFDDSVPWDDGLSFQPRQSLAPEQRSNVDSATGGRYGSVNRAPDMDGRQQPTARAAYFAEHADDNTDTLGHNEIDVPDRSAHSNAPVSSLVQHVFGEHEQDEGLNSTSPSHDDDVDSTAGGGGNGRGKNGLPVPPPPPAQDKSLSTLKQKLRGKQKPPAVRTATSKTKTDSKRAGTAKGKTTASSRAPQKQKAGANTGKPPQPHGRISQPTDSGMILPAVIEEKLYELEEEVKFYKSETLQLQKRKDYFEQEVKKLALERDEFAQYQQKQRVLIEKEWEQERAKMKTEQKLQDRQWKLRMNATISHQSRKDRGEVELLKAQIVKMQLDEKDLTTKWKAGNDNLRQRLMELEEKNRELSDEIKFLEKDRLEQWGKYECLVKEKQEATRSQTTPRITSEAAPFVLGERNELRTIDDVLAIKGTADELLQRWSFPNEGSRSEESGNQDHAFTEHPGYHHHLQSNAVDDYNPKRYSFDQEDPKHSSEGVFTDYSNLTRKREDKYASDADDARASAGAATFEWAIPNSEDDEALHGLDCRKSGDGDVDGAISAFTASVSEPKTVSQEIAHSGGKKELLFSDGSRKITFPDGNEKDIDANGHIVIKFTNGDHKELFPDTGISVYYYYEAQTKLTTYPDNRTVYEFPNQQVETSFPDGTTEIQFADGIKKTIRPNGDEFSVFPDGTTMLEQPDGLREVTLLNQKKIRYFPDGHMACVTSSGQETRVRSDSELKQLMET